MKTLVVLSALLAAVLGAPQTLLTPTIITSQSPIISQYHSQDTLGQYSYGYNGGSSAKIESKSLDGITRGSYSYVDADGKLQTVEYTADAVNGFRAAATNLPKAPIAPAVAISDNGLEQVQDTPEVALAKVEHARAYNEAALRAAAQPENPIDNPAPQPILALRSNPGAFSYTINGPSGFFAAPQLIAARSLPFSLQLPQDTPEVAQAKLEHFQAVEEQKSRIAAAAAAE